MHDLLRSAYTVDEKAVSESWLSLLFLRLLCTKIPVPNTPTWHKDLLNLAVEHNLVTGETADKMGKYLFFRHFFAHSYGFLLDETKLEPLMDDISDTYLEFKEEIVDYLTKIEE